jgi:hypothetical protein
MPPRKGGDIGDLPLLPGRRSGPVGCSCCRAFCFQAPTQSSWIGACARHACGLARTPKWGSSSYRSPHVDEASWHQPEVPTGGRRTALSRACQ